MLGQLLANLRTDGLDTPQFELIATCRQRLLQLLAHDVGIDVGLRGQAHEHVGLLA